ncbi:hypothetical protein [uncultured Bosea sp.]|uniref:hypothetical protein n=1 Tax=uncultured Bosea sp. TaxID=211457 RepID=UPI0025D2F5EA|nr:hypothetical protein [uncultured Bosea sp.]
MDRRSFITSLFGGLAIASIGGAALAGTDLAKAAAPAPQPLPPADPQALDAKTARKLDEADAEFTQVVRRERVYRHNRRGRPVVVDRRVVVRRDRFGRPVRRVVTRRRVY